MNCIYVILEQNSIFYQVIINIKSNTLIYKILFIIFIVKSFANHIHTRFLVNFSVFVMYQIVYFCEK